MIARKSTLIFLNSIVSAIFGAVALFFIAHYMGPEPLGIIGFGLGFMGMFGLLSDLGFRTAHIKRVSEGKDLDRCIGTYITIKIVLLGISIVVILLMIFLWDMIFHSVLTPVQKTVLYIFLINFILQQIASIPNATFGARKEIAKQQIPQFIATIFQAPASISVAIVGLSAVALAGTHTLAAIIVFMVSFLLFRGYSVKKPSKEYFRSYWQFALPMMLIISLGAIQINMDKIMIQIFWGTDYVGYYFSVQRITDVLMITSASVMALLLPTMSSYHTEKDFESIRKLTHLAERYLSMITTPMVIFIMVFAESIIDMLLGSAFIPAVPVLRILILLPLIASLNRPYWSQIMGINRPDVAAKLGVLGASMNIFLNLILIPKHVFGLKLLGLGATGAAVATLISWIIGGIFTRFIVFRLTKTTVNWRIIIHLAVGIFIAGILFYLESLIPVTRWFHLLGLGLGTFGFYFGVLYLLHEFTRSDVDFFLATLNPKKMKDYMVSEIKSG